jgi:hypothetical protein
LEGKISLVVQNRQTGNDPLASVGKGMHGTKETVHSSQEDVYDVLRSWSVICHCGERRNHSSESLIYPLYALCLRLLVRLNYMTSLSPYPLDLDVTHILSTQFRSKTPKMWI